MAELYEIENASGYNSWPMIAAAGKRLVCLYSCGKSHDIFEPCRKVLSRFSDDGGISWSEPSLVTDSNGCGDVPAGKGKGANGELLFWIRNTGEQDFRHELYRTSDGRSFEKTAFFRGSPNPMQITDIFHVPTIGLMSLWFAGIYRDKGASHAWGTLTSSDDGITWEQHTVEDGVPKEQWPTEPSAIYLGNGRIFAVARTESDGAVKRQFQLQSENSGRTWKKYSTNMTDVLASTPSLLFDPQSGNVSCYYYQRGAGLLKRRSAALETLWDHPDQWPEPEIIAHGSTDGPHHAGNVNVCRCGEQHHAAFYSGSADQASILTIALPE